MTGLPAILGGAPVFDSPLPFARPTLEDQPRVENLIKESLSSGRLTDGPLTRALEETAAERFSVDHCVAVSSCTTGLLFVLQALGIEGAVGLPSFTFAATAHAIRWNGLEPRFLDCDEDTWCLTPEVVEGPISALIGVHVSGVPCDVRCLEDLASKLDVPLVFDAAHAAGSLVSTDDGLRPLGGFGVAEVFSLTPTKVLSGAEGGLVTTNDAALAEHIRLARNYGNPGNYDTRFPGLNGRLSELHAALALVAFDHLEERVEHRNRVADRYRELLGEIPGVGFQSVGQGDRSSYKDFTILIGDGFGCSRDQVVAALDAEGVATRQYYSPPVHLHQAYADLPSRVLPVTEALGNQVISLPIWSHMSLGDVDRVAHAIRRIQDHAEALAGATE
jgi:dTDP-4-amino-4,6-dideoxygalactose transaminase